MATSTKNGKASTELANPATQEVEAFDPSTFDWDTLIQSADVVAGADLAKDELKLALVGIPFVATRVVFRPGAARKSYVSTELVIGSADVLKRRRIDMSTLPWEPGQSVVFNDGSTGVRRQLAQYLEAKGWITLPDGPEGGKLGESKYDVPPEEWVDITNGEIYFDENGRGIYTANIRLSCPRGLRKSEYTNDENPDGSVTCYFG